MESSADKILESNKKQCEWCGNTFVARCRTQKFCCKACCDKNDRKRRTAREKHVEYDEVFYTPKKPDPPKNTMPDVIEINKKAKAKGLSYGMYILLYGNGEK